MNTTPKFRGIRRAFWRHVGRFLVPARTPRPAADLALTEWVVTWRIHVEARSAEEAALVALAAQRDAESAATVFEVADDSGARHTVVCPVSEDPMALLEGHRPRRAARLSLVGS